MNKQQAIKSMRNLDDLISITESEHESVRMAISALEKQIPKKVTEVKCIHEDWEYCNDCEITLDCALGNVCPTCNNSLDYDCGEKDNYCPECGQKLDWSVEE